MPSAGDALRSLYVVVGVDTSPAIAGLTKLDVAFDASTAKARVLLETVMQLQAVVGRGGANGFSTAGAEMASSFEKANTQLLELRANAEKPIRINVTSAGGVAGGVAAGARGGGGTGGTTDYLGRSMFKTAAYLGMYAAFNEIRQGADADFTLRRVGVMTGQTQAQTMQLQRALQDRYYLNSTEAADAQAAVAALNIKDPGIRANLAQTAAAVQSIGGADATTEANLLYRLALTTSQNKPGRRLQDQLQNSFGMASAIQRVGEMNAGGVSGTTETLERLEAAGSLTGLDATTLVALAGTLGGVDPTRRATLTGAIERLTGKNLYQNAKTSAFLNSLGATAQLRESDPSQFMMKVAEGLSKIPPEKLEGVLTKAGFTNVRDITLMADFAKTAGQFSANLEAANEEMAKGTRLQEEVNQLHESTKGSIMELKASFSELGLTLVQKFGPAVSGGLQAHSAGIRGTGNSSMGMIALAGLGGAFLGKRIFRGAESAGLFKSSSIAASLGMTVEEFNDRIAINELRKGGAGAIAELAAKDPAAAARLLGKMTASDAAAAATAAAKGPGWFARMELRNDELGMAARGLGRSGRWLGGVPDALYLNRRIGFRSAGRLAGTMAEEDAAMMAGQMLNGEEVFGGRVARRGFLSKFSSVGEKMGAWGTSVLEGAAGKEGEGFLGKLFGKGLMERVAARGAIAASTAEIPIVDILTSLGMLAPILHGIGGWLDKIGKKGGIIGLIANSFGTLFHVLGLVGDVVNKVIDGIMWAVKKILDFPPIKAIIGGLNWIGGKINEGLTAASGWVNGIGESHDGAIAPAAANPVRTVNHIAITAGSQASVDRYLARAASRNAVGYSPQGMPGGS